MPEPGIDGRGAARAIDAIRRGWPIRVGTMTLLAIEGADAVTLPAFDPRANARILISAARAQTLKLTNQREAAEDDAAVLVERAPWIDLDVATAIADPVRDLSSPLKGPFRSAHLAAPADAAAALRLARLAGILPAFFVSADDAEVATEVAVTSADVDAFDDPVNLAIATRARLPVAAGGVAEIIAFRTPHDAREHVALVIGTRDERAPVVRVHSECLTGDVFGSLKCDCGPQLHSALERIADAGWGVLLYLRQEGRGIGLINKLRAYALQDQGFDTVDANIRLGFAVDARDFAVAARMLALLGIDRVRLLTNNPQKVARLEATGIAVVERLPLVIAANPENAAYLDAKRDRTGHQL